jgi:hypothetical protein
MTFARKLIIDSPTKLKPMSGEDLQAARRLSAERFTAIAMAELPAGWTYKLRKSLSGRCFVNYRYISAPKPVTRKALYIWLHECAHAHGINRTNMRRTPAHVIEMRAEKWAHAKMREHGVPVPKEMTQRAQGYVRRKIKQVAQRRGSTPKRRRLPSAR